MLKPHGKFMIITANHKSLTEWQKAYDAYEMEGSKLVGKNLIDGTPVVEDTLYIRSEKELIDNFNTTGLEVLETQDIRLWLAISGTN